MRKSHRLIDRDLSWLAFNGRVLQEAADARVPLIERLRFLAIYSSNLDEFFRVRVASLLALLNLKNKGGKSLDVDPERLLRRIRRTVDRQQEAFGRLYREEILVGLRAHGVMFVTERELTPEQDAAAREVFDATVRGTFEPVFVDPDGAPPFLYNRRLYLAVVLEDETPDGRQSRSSGSVRNLALLEIPTERASRFIELPGSNGQRCFMFLDDLLRLILPEVFPRRRVVGAYAVKLTRDADLSIDDEFSGDLLEKIRKGLSKRKTGAPSRFLYDGEMPRAALAMLRDALGLRREELIRGWRYHNFNDFFGFPDLDIDGMEYDPAPSLPRNDLDAVDSMFDAIDAGDRMLHYPYHSYHYTIRFLREATTDPDVREISITLYRVAAQSQIVQALIEAAGAGKRVTAFVEVKARFDEEANLYWAGQLERAGVHVIYSFPGLKVHCKLCLVTRIVKGTARLYGYLSSGNFNEKTARLYCDHGLFTADPRITGETAKVFEFLATRRPPDDLDHLLVAPFTMRERFIELLRHEAENARSGIHGSVILQLNSLEDPEMIEELRSAAESGVHIKLVVRGICRLAPESVRGPGSIEAVSIVDRFLEHARVYIFHNGGDELCFVGSADWMTRNLSRRVEVAFPIFDARIRHELRRIIDLQLRDNVKARILNGTLDNPYRAVYGEQIQSQAEIYDMVRENFALPIAPRFSLGDVDSQ